MLNAVEDDELVMRLVESALERPPNEREDHLRQTCGEDASLYKEVRSRVEWEERLGNFLRESLPLRLYEPSRWPLPQRREIICPENIPQTAAQTFLP